MLTAYFSSSRRPGVVFRVSTIWAPVPSTARTYCLVNVATPDIRCSRFNATRSPVRRTSAEPFSVPKIVPSSTSSPSLKLVSISPLSASRCKKYRFRDIDPADNKVFLRKEPPDTANFRIDRRLRSNIAAANVLDQKSPDRA